MVRTAPKFGGANVAAWVCATIRINRKGVRDDRCAERGLLVAGFRQRVVRITRHWNRRSVAAAWTKPRNHFALVE
jgi:hypothetical protein